MTGKGNEASEKLDREIGAKCGHLFQRVDPTKPAPEFKAWEEPRVSASMAEVVAEALATFFTRESLSGTEHRALVGKHAAEQLAANGYGKLEDAWDEGLSAGQDRWLDSREFGDPPVNPYRRPE